jgi:3-oxoadipate enol-lactonase
VPFLKCGAINFAYETSGRGKPLVLVHGWGAESGMYAEQMEAFSRHYTVIVYDQRGHGKSTKLPRTDDYAIDRFAEDLASILDVLGYARVRLLGHSMGGNVALSFALGYPERVEKLVLASTFAQRSLSAWESFQLSIARFIPLALIARPFAASCMSKPDEKQISRVVGYYRNAGKDVLLKSARAIGNVNFRDRLGAVRCPALILYGDADRAVAPENTRVLCEGIPGARLHAIRGGGHAINWENIDEFNRAVLDFLAE